MGNAPSKERIIVQEWPTEEDAFLGERFLIALYGREDLGEGCLLNMSDGGESPPNHRGKKRSEETRQKLGAWKRTVETKKNISDGVSAHYAADVSLVGKRFGRLVVTARAGKKRHDAQWEVQCDCGTPPKLVVGANLKRGHIKSCGCLRKESLKLGPIARRKKRL
jgi:hypothetical protein